MRPGSSELAILNVRFWIVCYALITVRRRAASSTT